MISMLFLDLARPVKSYHCTKFGHVGWAAVGGIGLRQVGGNGRYRILRVKQLLRVLRPT